jgi:uncharacterized membrane protein YhaH (DUF805 family)
MEMMFEPFRKYVDFQGRARRSEFWLFALFVTVLFVICVVISAIGESNKIPALQAIGGLALLVLSLGTILPGLAVRFRRLHDIDRSAWWIFIALVPLVGGIVLLIFSVTDGTPGKNRYGPDPKGRGDTEAAAFE